MLSLSRYRGERIRIRLEDNRDIWIAVGEIRGSARNYEGRVRLLFDAPRTIQISREELLVVDEEDNQ